MQLLPTHIPDLLHLEPQVFGDERGFLVEIYRAERYRAMGILCDFVQDNHSRSRQGVVRGLHYQRPTDHHPGQAKLVSCVRGLIWDVAVDLRTESPTFGHWQSFELSEDNHHQLFLPVGFAHGFAVLSEVAEVLYKCSSPYDAEAEAGVHWADPTLQVEWPVADPILSPRDRQNPSFAAYCRAPAF